MGGPMFQGFGMSAAVVLCVGRQQQQRALCEKTGKGGCNQKESKRHKRWRGAPDGMRHSKGVGDTQNNDNEASLFPCPAPPAPQKPRRYAGTNTNKCNQRCCRARQTHAKGVCFAVARQSAQKAPHTQHAASSMLPGRRHFAVSGGLQQEPLLPPAAAGFAAVLITAAAAAVERVRPLSAYAEQDLARIVPLWQTALNTLHRSAPTLPSTLGTHTPLPSMWHLPMPSGQAPTCVDCREKGGKANGEGTDRFMFGGAPELSRKLQG